MVDAFPFSQYHLYCTEEFKGNKSSDLGTFTCFNVQCLVGSDIVTIYMVQHGNQLLVKFFHASTILIVGTMIVSSLDDRGEIGTSNQLRGST